MIHMAFCDDDLSVLRQLSALTDQYRVSRNQEIAYATYLSPLELLAALERGARYDILFLDILMPGENGIEAAGEIRALDDAVKIIFLTSSNEFAAESYKVSAYFYQLKPIWEESFFRLLDSVLAECGRQEDSLVLKCRGGITRVQLAQLEYCEVVGRAIFLHLSHGQVLESGGRLDELSGQLLPRGNFLRPHRSYLVNMDYIQRISYRAITLACLAEIPIPRGKYAELKAAFLEYAFHTGQVPL